MWKNLVEPKRPQMETYRKKRLCVKLVIYKDYTEMHGQKNTKFLKYIFIFNCERISTLYFRQDLSSE